MPHRVRGLIWVLAAATGLFSGTLVILFPKNTTLLGIVLFHLPTLTYGTICPFISLLRTILEHFTSLLKMHLFRLAFDMQCFQPTSIVYFLAFITMFTIAFFSFNIQSISCYTFTF